MRYGVWDNTVHEQILCEPNIDLKKAVKLGQAAEETRKHVQELTDDLEKSID